ncbi:MAG TPA: hypothetical protein VFD43_06645 [Planctomycetota bacterium]|nr:hypothetical protein [Planctomycetota bacterium]
MAGGQGTGHVFHPGHDEWHGQTVVVYTKGTRTVAGRWDAIVDGQLQMRDAAVHDGGTEAEPRAEWVARLKQFGIPVQHGSFALVAEDVERVVRLRDA